MAHKILCTIGKAFAAEGKKILETIGEVRYAVLTQKEFPSQLRDVTILVTQLGLHINAEAMEAAPNLRYIATPTTGLDHIDLEEAKRRGITVLSLKGETKFLNSVTATAEMALGLTIALVRKIPAAHNSVVAGRWDRAAFQGHSLSTKTLGIVGLGRLGKMMARYGKALGMEVIHTDPYETGSIPLEELLRRSDVVTLHVHLQPDTEGMIGAKELKMMKKGAVLINTARAKIVDEAAILKALKEGSLAGYATDVLEDELSFTKDDAKSAMIDYAKTHDNLIITPHTGGTTTEAREATDIFIAQKLTETLQ